ncbi:MAG TPA: AI-2E family transporter [Jatrophihabitans sp.]|jgi:predicted PurR-regulated permease PerM|uniref:AI-2E family transporter n=1 Tax=Jatrophihabitans sp. TaxID=1932789 RepID=UPI002EFE6C1C
MFTRRSRSDTAPSVAEPAPVAAETTADHRRPATTGSTAVIERVGASVATWSLRLLLTAAALVVVAWVLGKLWDAVLPIVLGLLLASVLWPVTRLLRRFVPPAVAALLTLVGALGILAGLGAILVPQVSDEWPELTDAVAAGIEDLEEYVAGPPFNLDAAALSEYVDQAVERLQSNSGSIVGSVLSGVTTVGHLLVHGVLALVLCFFFLKDGPKFVPWLTRWVGPRAGRHLGELSVRSWGNLSGFIRAQAAVGLVDAVAIGIGLAILGVPFALPLAVLVFFGAFIPIIGAFVTGALAALVALVTNGLTSALIVVVLVLVVQQVEGHILQPILVGRALDLHAALVILAVTTGGALAGITGAFLAVPLVAVVVTMVRYAREQFLDRTEPSAAAPVPPPASDSTLDAVSTATTSATHTQLPPG